MSAEEIKLEIHYTEAEYLTACRLLTLRSSGTLIRGAVSLLLVLFGSLLLASLVADVPLMLILIVALLFPAAIGYAVLVRLPRQNFRGDPKFRDKYELTFSEEGVAVKTRQVDSKLAWSLYTKVIEGKDQYLLVYGKDLRMMTVIPKRVFESSAQENKFRQLLARHISDHTRIGRFKASEDREPEYTPRSLNPPDWR